MRVLEPDTLASGDIAPVVAVDASAPRVFRKQER